MNKSNKSTDTNKSYIQQKKQIIKKLNVYKWIIYRVIYYECITDIV